MNAEITFDDRGQPLTCTIDGRTVDVPEEVDTGYGRHYHHPERIAAAISALGHEVDAAKLDMRPHPTSRHAVVVPLQR